MYEHVDKIIAEIGVALNKRVATNKKHSAQGSTLPMQHSELAALRKTIKGYKRCLLSLHRAINKKSKVGIQVARKRIDDSFDARLCAVLRSTAKVNKPYSYEELVQLAEALNLNFFYQEPIIVKPEPKPDGTFRPICHSGRKRRCQQFILRDVLLVSMGDNVHDSTVAGAGGEKEQIEKIKKTIESGYHHWVSLDIKDFFSSLRPGHLKGFPLSKWKVENILFLPSDTPIKFVDQKHGVALVDPSVLKGYECDQSYGDVSYGQILSQVQLGLLQGDVCAPQIARTVLGKELQLTLGEMGIVWFSHLDDLAIGACSQKELKTALEALKTRLSSHPAGPLEFHEHKCSNVHEGFEFLKYRISIRKQDGVLHVRPAKSRFKRFRYRLWARLEDSGVYTKKGLWQCALKYASSWYISQQAWTKRTYVDESGNTVDASWECVLTELEYLVNKFIFDEWLDDIGNWHESDIKFDVIGEQEAIL